MIFQFFKFSKWPCGANFGPILSKSWYVRDIILYKLVYEYESSTPKPLDEILFTSLFLDPKISFFGLIWPFLAWFGSKVDTSKKLSHLTYIFNYKALAAKLWPVGCSQAHPDANADANADADADGYTQVHTDKKFWGVNHTGCRPPRGGSQN